VLKGGVNTLKDNKPILMIETMDENLVKAGTSVMEVVDFVLNLGYEAFGIDSIGFVKYDGKKNFINMLFIHKHSDLLNLI